MKPWRRSVGFSLVLLLILGSTAFSAPVYYVSGAKLAIQEFTPSADGSLTGIGFWSLNGGTEFDAAYTVRAYQSGGASGPSGQLATVSGDVLTPGYHSFYFDSPVSVDAGVPVWLFVNTADNSKHHAVDVDSPQPGISYFSTSGATWSDLHSAYNSLAWDPNSPAPANFVINPLMAGISLAGQHGDNWTVTDWTYDGNQTLDVQATATEMEPLVMEIEVEGGLSSINLTELVTNNTDDDWIGYGFQLGSWDGERFRPSTEADLTFGFSQSPDFGPMQSVAPDHIVFRDGLVPPGDSTAFELAVNLAGGMENFTFAVRQYAIPEPASVVLLAMGAVLLLGFRRRR